MLANLSENLNLVFAFLLVRAHREAGLAAANTASALFNAALLLYALRRKLSRLGMADLPRTVCALLGAAAVAGATAFFLSWFWESRLGHSSLPLKIGAVFAPGTIAGVIYWLVALWAKVPAAKEMLGLARRGPKQML